MLFRQNSICRFFASALFALVMSLSFAVPASAVDFLNAIQDLPLPSGFVELENAVEFETPFGRIVETTAEGAGTIDQSLAYYKASLPAFGWTLVEAPLVFERGTERLYIDLKSIDAGVRAEFKLVVQPASSVMND